MKSVATVMQVTRSLLILTPAEYDKPEGGLAGKRKGGAMPTNFSVPQIFELNESLKDHPFEKSEELAAFVKRCAESVQMDLGDIFLCIEDEDILITKEYKHHVESKPKMLLTYARVEAEAVLHSDVEKYTILNFEYGQQYGKANKTEDVSASLFAMNTGMLTDIRANFSAAGLRIVKVTPPIAGLLYTSKADLNSATRAIAVISMDFAATRLVVLHNGAPVFQQSFSSVLEDIAEMLMLEFGISKLGAIDLIRQEGLGICNKCNSATTRKQTMSMLENAASEILRNLRMVISTMRLDIDQIVLCDALAKLPNIAAYCRQIGLTAPMEKVTNLFSAQSQPPTVTQAAQQRGFDAVSFITLNGILTMPIPEANLLQGETNILSAMAKDNSNKVGNIVAGAIGFLAAVWMIAMVGWWVALEIQKNNDENTLKDERYKYAQDLIDREKKYTELTRNLTTNLELLPKTEYKMSVILEHVMKEYVEKTLTTNDITIAKRFNSDNDSTDVIVDLTSTVKNYDSFVSLKEKIDDAGFFAVDESLSISKDMMTVGNAAAVYNLSMSMAVAEKGFEQAALSEKEKQELEEKMQNGGKSQEESSGSEASDGQTSQTSQASSAASEVSSTSSAQASGT